MPIPAKLIAKNASRNLKLLMVVLQTVRDSAQNIFTFMIAPTMSRRLAQVLTAVRSGILWETSYNPGA